MLDTPEHPIPSIGTDALVGALMVEAAAVGANPSRFELGPWVGVMADESWLTSLGYDEGPWRQRRRPADAVPPAIPFLVDHVERVAVITRAFSFHQPPLHNGCPSPPQVNSRRAMVVFIPRED